MKYLGIIPARGGSKGVPKKNIKLLGGKPLIWYTIESALESKKLGKVIVSTDSKEIADFSIKCGVEVPFLRPEELALDNTGSIEVVKHALKYFLNCNLIFDAVVLLQPTTPFRSKEMIDECILQFETSEADSLISVLPVPHNYNPHWVFEKNKEGYLKISCGDNNIITRRQDLPSAYHRDGAVYITKSKIITEYNSFLGEKITAFKSMEDNYVNIDTIDDWRRAELLISKLEK